jgi:hypothetical protein
MLAQDVELMGIVFRRAARDIPPVGMPGDHAQRLSLAATPDHDRRDRLRVWKAIGILDVVVRPSKGRRRLSPQPLDDLYRIFQLIDSGASRVEREVVLTVLFFHPPGPQTEQEAPAGEPLEVRSHLCQQRRVAIGLADHACAKLERREGGCQVRDRGQTFEIGRLVGDPPGSRDDMIVHPDGVEGRLEAG